MAEDLTILIIDDDQVDRLTIKRSLKNAGFQVQTEMAESGVQGLKLLREIKFDCLLIDFKLPDIDGLELLQEIRKINREVPVVLVTSYGDERIAANAIKLGASDYISKALLTPEGLSHSIRNAIRLHHIEIEKREAERRLQNVQQQLQTVVENTPIILWGLNPEGIFTFASGNGLEVVGLKPEDIVGKSIVEVSQNDQKVISRLNRAIKGEITKATHELRGHYFETLYRTNYNANNEISGLTCISFEVTERVKSQKAMQKAKELAEESIKVKEQFFTNMSHEIRTPMNGILGLTGILQKTTLSAEQQSYLDAIKTSSEKLLVIINDLLDFSKMEAGKITLEETDFNLRKLLQDTIEVLKPKADERNDRLKVIIDSEIPEQLNGDPVRLNQILNNLIGNAIKFTENGQIRVIIDLINQSADQALLEFEIEDNGIGIPEDKLDKIFEIFTQASNDTTRKYGGTGLGLSISRQLIEMQGGKISVQSKPNEGSTFRFRLPFKLSKEAEKPVTVSEETIDPAELGELDILLAEDNEINQLLARKVITDWGFNLDIANNGKEAIDLLKKKNYDLVLMDMQMPEMDGYEATVYIRTQMGRKSNIPIIAFTAHATKTEIGKCMLAGADAYVSKPFVPEQLLAEIYDQINKDPGVIFKPDFENTPAPEVEELGEINLDLSFLKEMAAGNQEFIKEVIDLFLTITPESLNKMETALKDEDWPGLAGTAHRLKSSIYLVGIKELELNISAIENSAKNAEDRHLLPRLLSRTRKICEAAMEKLKGREAY